MLTVSTDAIFIDRAIAAVPRRNVRLSDSTRPLSPRGVPCAQEIFNVCKKRDPDQKEFLQARVDSTATPFCPDRPLCLHRVPG
jgi:hypothetical protein